MWLYIGIIYLERFKVKVIYKKYYLFIIDFLLLRKVVFGLNMLINREFYLNYNMMLFNERMYFSLYI